ncbi:hypothetical protein [Thioalkalivibrio sp. ARh3]|uniref:hypothetical protein n=1 Tax=Thioalkalivibrio sp. ARh3 TaxID=1158148 RepID=UPI0003748093|nr:hypothetical protein [Thioalkalivibrio sp. ARh3]
MDEWQYEMAEREERRARDQAVEAARAADQSPAPEWDGDTAYCPQCGNENTARAKIGRGRCIDCQEIHDSLRKRGLA